MESIDCSIIHVIYLFFKTIKFKRKYCTILTIHFFFCIYKIKIINIFLFYSDLNKIEESQINLNKDSPTTAGNIIALQYNYVFLIIYLSHTILYTIANIIMHIVTFILFLFLNF